MKKTLGRRAALIAATGLVAASIGVSTGSANAQPTVVVGVAFEHLTEGTSVDCPFDVPQTGGTVTGIVDCAVFAHAEGGQIHNHCKEGVAVDLGQPDVSVGVSGCSVVVDGTVTVAYEGTGTRSGPVYTCGGAGLGIATYTPSAQGVGQSMDGPVLLSYDDGVLTVDGALVNLGTLTAGHIHAEGMDPCGPDNLAHPFVGAIT